MPVTKQQKASLNASGFARLPKGRKDKASAKSKKPTVACIIPYYNGSETIERAIRSVFYQTIPANEVIIVNDGSSAEERMALENFRKIYSFKIIDKENGGQGSARNLGVRSSKSEYISFLDQDDFYLDNHNEILLEACSRSATRFGVAYANLWEADKDGNLMSTVIIQDPQNHPKKSMYAVMRNDLFILPSASLISREAFMEVQGFDEQFRGYEDDDLFMRIFRARFQFVFVDKPVTVWCIHEGSTSYSTTMSVSRYRYFKKLLKTFPDRPKRDLYYFREFLIPRFGRQFVDDVIRSSQDGNPNLMQLRDIFRSFCGDVWENPNINIRQKMGVYIAMIGLCSLPRWSARLLSKLGLLQALRQLV